MPARVSVCLARGSSYYCRANVANLIWRSLAPKKSIRAAIGADRVIRQSCRDILAVRGVQDLSPMTCGHGRLGPKPPRTGPRLTLRSCSSRGRFPRNRCFWVGPRFLRPLHCTICSKKRDPRKCDCCGCGEARAGNSHCNSTPHRSGLTQNCCDNTLPTRFAPRSAMMRVALSAEYNSGSGKRTSRSYADHHAPE